MPEDRARCYKNTLNPAPLTPETVSALDAALSSAIQGITTHAPSPGTDKHDTLYADSTGIALMYLRLSQQRPGAVENCNKRALKHLPKLHHHHSPPAGRLSPIGSLTGPAVVEIMRQLIFEETDDARWETAMSTMSKAVGVAVVSDEDDADEVLYGRAGLLWALLNLRRLARNTIRDGGLRRVVNDEVIRQIVTKIIEVGRRGSKKTGFFADAPPSWAWHGKVYLGAMHGSAGILTVLLQCPREIIEPFLPEIFQTINFLCSIANDCSGHIPSSLPAKDRSHPYVQICHGSPGLLLLLSTLKRHCPEEWSQDHESTAELAAEAVWTNSLLKKGLGICHGAAGNAWVLLLLEDEKWVQKAVALLLKAGDMPPLGQDTTFRTPDAPWSLFEGVAGTALAFAEAANLLEGKRDSLMGFPGLGGMGARGLI